jgi:hypothetical protein
MALHKRTIEITRDNQISKRADCIIGVSSSKACTDLSRDAKDWIFSGGWLRFEIKTLFHTFAFEGKGSPKLELADEREIVLRVSDYISPRTAAINCTQSAYDIPRSMINELQNPQSSAVLRIIALPLKMEKEFVWSLP